MRGGQGGNKEFEEAAIEARSESSKWVEVLVEGKLGRNNALKLAGTKQASAQAAPCCFQLFQIVLQMIKAQTIDLKQAHRRQRTERK